VLTNVSNAASAPEENRPPCGSNASSESAQKPLSFFQEQESHDASVNIEKEEPFISKCRSVEEIPRTVTVNGCKNIDSKKVFSNINNNSGLAGSHAQKEQPRKGEHLVQLCENGISQDTKPPNIGYA